MLVSANFTVRYRSGFTVGAVELRIEAGEVFALVGESGSGKSTIIKSFLGLLPTTAECTGELRVGNTDLLLCSSSERRRVLRRDLGYVPQDASACFSPYTTMRRQLFSFWQARVGRSERAEFDQTCEITLSVLGLEIGVLDRYPTQLSIGQLQRIAIANAVLSKPPLLIADEPTSALDVITAAEVLRFFAFLKQQGTALLLVTHDLSTAFALATSIAVLKQGRVVEQSPAENLRVAPGHPYTRALLAAHRQLTGATHEDDPALIVRA